MRPNLRTIALVTAVGLMAATGISGAQETRIIQAAVVSEDNAQERIAVSGKLRMLSQRIPSAACHAISGIDVENSAKLLNASIDEFEKILSALEFGDTDLNITSVEERRKTIAKIHETRETWLPFKAAASAIVAGDNQSENLKIVLNQSPVVFGSAQTLVSELVGQYSTSPSTVQADVFLIDLAGRQLMLTQKMSKESCIISITDGDADAVDALQGTMQMFELSLEALRFGMPELGIRKPPTPEISAGLGDVLTEWQAVKPLLETVLAGKRLDADAETRKFQALNSTMRTIDNVVGLYAEAGKHEL